MLLTRLGISVEMRQAETWQPFLRYESIDSAGRSAVAAFVRPYREGRAPFRKLLVAELENKAHGFIRELNQDGPIQVRAALRV